MSEPDHDWATRSARACSTVPADIDPPGHNLARCYLDLHAEASTLRGEVERLRAEQDRLMETMKVVAQNARDDEARAKRIADGAYVTQETMEEILASSREAHAERDTLAARVKELTEALRRAYSGLNDTADELLAARASACDERDAALAEVERLRAERDEATSYMDSYIKRLVATEAERDTLAARVSELWRWLDAEIEANCEKQSALVDPDDSDDPDVNFFRGKLCSLRMARRALLKASPDAE